MVTVNIKSQSLKDAANGIAIDPNLNYDNTQEAKDITIAFLEGGTVSGQNTVMIILKDGKGNCMVGELTAKLFEGVYSAYQGATVRFNSEKIKFPKP